MAKTRQVLRDARQFFHDYTAGVEPDALRRLFDRDAANVYQVLTRDQPGAESAGDGRRFLHRAKVLFLGLSYKLSPPRRILFAASLLFALVGLIGGGHVVLASKETRIALDFSPFYFLLSLAGLVYLLAMELVDRVRFRDELEVARQLQHDLLPQRSPILPGYDFAHSYSTANTIGGDYHDFLALPDGRLAVLVGDASGHGIAAGLLMAIVSASLKSALDLDPTPARVLEFLNRVLCRTGDRRAFMTAFFAVLDPPTHRLEFACAGHPFPLLRRAEGTVEELDDGGSLPLGVRPDLAVRRGAISLAGGDTLVLYTDGLPEALDGESRAFGFERLAALAAEPGSPQAIHDRILAAFRDHVGNQPLTDDLTLVVVARRP